MGILKDGIILKMELIYIRILPLIIIMELIATQ